MQDDRIHISTDIVINAKKEDVWLVLSDLAKWPSWNSLIVSFAGNFSKNASLTLEFADPDNGAISFNRTMFLFEEGKSFGWTGEAFAGLKDHHIFTIEELPDRRTRFTQADGLYGAEVPGVDEIEQQMLAGYKLFNQELKTFVESNFPKVI